LWAIIDMGSVGPQSPPTTRETADYLERLARELRAIAAQSDLEFLAYLFSMVEEDAAATVRRLTGK
jgi:hypothetical protein